MSYVQAKTEKANSDDTLAVFRGLDPSSAENIRLILSLCEIRAAVIRRDVLGLGMAVFEVAINSTAIIKANEAIDREVNHRTEDWLCPNCSESVPNTFDSCWNCDSSAPD